MSILTIILFFLYTWGLGYSVSFFMKKPLNFLEKNIIRIAIGLSIMPFILVLLSTIRIPLDWRIILVISMAFPAYSTYKFFSQGNEIEIKPKIKKSDLYTLGAIILFVLSLFMYAKGAFIYPYLEDDDPWSHANGIKYVSIEKTVINPSGGTGYLDPYPPGYDGILGILHQTSSKIMWTMKFFNSLIISLSILFFYFFAKEFTKSRKKALFSTFILAAIPCYLSHFIWAHSLIPLLIIMSFYSLEKIKEDKKYSIISALIIASILLTQPSQPFKYAFMFLIYFIVKFIYQKKESFFVLGSGISGLILSLIWWGTRWKSQLGAGAHVKTSEVISSEVSKTLFEKLSSFFGVILKAFDPRSGSATRVYNFNDFFIAQHQNMINNPFGVGIFIMLILFISFIFLALFFAKKTKENKPASKLRTYLTWTIILLSGLLTIFSFFFKWLFGIVCIIICLVALYFLTKDTKENKRKNSWKLITLLWLLFTFLGINALTFNLPVGLFAFRFWMLFAIPVALLSCLFLDFTDIFSKNNKTLKIVFLLIIIIGVIFTSAHQKYSVNTANWGSGAFWTYVQDTSSGRVYSPELEGYLWMKDNLEPNTKVFSFSNPGAINGVNMFSCSWCSDEISFRKNNFNASAEEIYSFLREKGYNYLLIDGQTVKKFGANESNMKIQEIAENRNFGLIHQNQGFLLFNRY